MPFVNEYASQEDIKKYGLEELWERYENGFKVFPSTRTSLTIDRERDVFLMYVNNMRAKGEDRMQGPESVWVLYYQGEDIEVRLNHSPESIAPSGPLMEVLNEKRRALEEGKVYDHVIIKQVWDLLSIKPTHTQDTTKEELKQIIKEALIVYGRAGARNKPLLVENTLVQCNW